MVLAGRPDASLREVSQRAEACKDIIGARRGVIAAECLRS
jgi:hypothetical protein